MSRVLTNEDLLEIIRLKNVENYPSRKIAEIFGCGKTTINDFLSKKTHTEFWGSYEPHAAGELKPKNHDRPPLPKAKGYVFTSAQNNTYANKNFFEALVNYCKVNDYLLIVSTFTYNKNGFQNGLGQKEVWYDPLIRPYIVNELSSVFKGLDFCGNLNILPTAINPLSGFDSYTGMNSAIVPHAKMQLKSLPRHLDDIDPKMLYTTGAVTRLNYIQQKAGQKAEWDHVFGAVVAEIDEDGDWFVRQLNADDETGEFYDLDYKYTPFDVQYVGQVLAINWGDLHIEKIDKSVALGAMSVLIEQDEDGVKFTQVEDHNSMLFTLNPMYQFFHDTSDFTYRNHHNIKDPHFRFKMFSAKTESVKQSMQVVADFVNAASVDFSTTVIVESNHDLAFTRWLKSADYKEDPVNAVFFLESQLKLYSAIEDGTYGGFHLLGETLESLNEDLATKDVIWLDEGESFRLHDIEFGYHGHQGPNGARGSAISLSKLGVKTNLGHSHTPVIFNGCVQAGTSSELRMGYNNGAPSSWSHSHIVTYLNGKRSIITMRGSKWQAI